MISIEQSFYTAFPALSHGRARDLAQPVVALLRRIACEERINAEVGALAGARGLDFVARALERLRFSYLVAPTDRANIPAEGRMLLVANHPLGALDALALLDLVGSVRSDVRIVGNRVLRQLDGLGELLLDCEVFGERGAGAGLRAVYRALQADQAVILFPAGEVSRVRADGVRDAAWAPGFVRFARKCGAPVVPVHVAASNSPAFYGASMLAKPLATLMLPRELFGKQDARISLTVGQPVAAEALGACHAEPERIAQAMRRHVYRLAKRKPPLFATSSAIAHPESPLQVRAALARGEVLGGTRDGKRIVLLDADLSCPALREIGRLRELSFRRVGEGTGLRRDLDAYDQHYRHIVLWDDAALEMVGAYRLGEGARIVPERGVAGLYSSSLFEYQPEAAEFLASSVELGRSFVHPRHWGSRSLDYLWQGIGAYLRTRPQLRYLVGPVSLSRELPEPLRQRIVATHLHYFGRGGFARARNPYPLPSALLAEVSSACAGLDAEQGLAALRRQVQTAGAVYPVLYRQYVELCSQDGITFADFGLDPGFGHCVDGLIRLDLQALKPHKRSRYLQCRSAVADPSAD